MEKVLELLTTSLKNGNLLGAVVIIAVAFVFNYKNIIIFIDERKKAKIAKLNEALKCPYIEEVTKTYLQNQLAAEQFKITTGVFLEKEFREALIKAHSDAQGEVAFTHFKRALRYITFKDAGLEIKLSLYDHLSFGFNWFVGTSIIIISCLYMILPSQIKGITVMQALSIIGVSLVYIMAGMFMLYQTFSYTSAKRVSKFLPPPRGSKKA